MTNHKVIQTKRDGKQVPCKCCHPEKVELQVQLFYIQQFARAGQRENMMILYSGISVEWNE